MEFVGAHLANLRVAASAIPHRRTDLLRYGKQVDAAAAKRGRGLAAENEFMGEFLVEGRVLRGSTDTIGPGKFRSVADPLALVVQTDNIQDSGHRHSRLGIVHRAGSGSSGILFVHDVTKLLCQLRPFFARVLLTDFVADAP